MVSVSSADGPAHAVRAADEDQGPVVLGDVVEEHVEVQGERLGHAILRVVSGEVVVPLPGLAGERHLGVDLGLLDVELVVAEDLPRGLDEARMAQRRAKTSLRRWSPIAVRTSPLTFSRMFAGCPPRRPQPRPRAGPRPPPARRGGQDEEAVLPEVLDLRWGQLHGGVPSAMSRQTCPAGSLPTNQIFLSMIQMV